MLVPVLNSFSSLAHTYAAGAQARCVGRGLAVSAARAVAADTVAWLGGLGGGRGGVGGDLTDSCRGFSFSPPTIVLMWTWVMYDPSTVSEPLSSLMTKVASSVLTLTLTLGPEKKQ